jgi:hypothetical protein
MVALLRLRRQALTAARIARLMLDSLAHHSGKRNWACHQMLRGGRSTSTFSPIWRKIGSLLNARIRLAKIIDENF